MSLGILSHNDNNNLNDVYFSDSDLVNFDYKQFSDDKSNNPILDLKFTNNGVPIHSNIKISKSQDKKNPTDIHNKNDNSEIIALENHIRARLIREIHKWSHNPGMYSGQIDQFNSIMPEPFKLKKSINNDSSCETFAVSDCDITSLYSDNLCCFEEFFRNYKKKYIHKLQSWLQNYDKFHI